MSAFNDELVLRLKGLREQNLYRELRRVDAPQTPRLVVGGRTYLNFSSNDYLGLANDPLLKDAAIKAVREFGVGAGSSRLICGSLAPYHELDEALAVFKGTQAALSFSSGYATSLGTIGALLNSNDVVVLDKLIHASIIDAARLSGAKVRVFGHNNLDDLEKILRWADTRNAMPSDVPTDRKPRTLIVTESVFSMDGDHAPLREIVALKERFGAWLMVDEAHATGLYGKMRRGLAEELGVAGKIEVQMGTLGKSFGSAGGYICGTRSLVEFLINRARSFIFSTAPVPAAAAAATAGVRFVQSAAGEARRNKLWSNIEAFVQGDEQEPHPGGTEQRQKHSAIIPLMIGDESKAMKIADGLRGHGIFVPAIRYPTVAHGQARLRLTFSAAHELADIARLHAALQSDLRF
jgi:8-amino-7-oxononanoate synthase